MSSKNLFNSKAALKAKAGEFTIFRLDSLVKAGVGRVERLPYSIKVLLECALRNFDDYQVTEADISKIASWDPKDPGESEIPFKPGRIILQDFTGVPAMVDLAAMRSAMKRLGGDPKKINPEVPCDLVIDHSIQVDAFGTPDALQINIQKEFQRNRERYEFLKWGQKAFENFRVVPPGRGIIHQINLEYFSKCVLIKKEEGVTSLFPDSLVGTDSHTTTINGLGVVGWGVGGIEAEAVMLGQPIYMLMPEVIGFKLTGKLRPDVTATDLVLTVTQMLRKKGVVGKFIEYFGSALDQMGVADRAVLANMSPEYGATMGFFPIDQETLKFLRLTGKTEAEVELVERYTKEQGMFHSQDSKEPEYTEVISLDLSTVEPSLAGPKRPQDRVPLKQMKENFKKTLVTPIAERGFGLTGEILSAKKEILVQNSRSEISHGAVVIASITSCTNTSDPDVMIGAGLLAKRAAEKGLTTKSYVKTSLAPGSRAVTEYLKQAGLLEPLEKLGFFNAGYGCMTCIGNSGPLPEPVAEAVTAGKLVAASVLSGNRNFEGRVHPQVKANYLASPALVVAYALAGTVDFDFEKEALGKDKNGKPVFLKDIWPLASEIQTVREKVFTPEAFRDCYHDIFEGTTEWKALEAPQGELYEWNPKSTYIQEPPFFMDLDAAHRKAKPIRNARCLAVFGDSITTDHISPAGSIKTDSPAGKFLIENGVSKEDFNSYGARRGNDRVMARGTFANIRLRNLLAPGTEGGVTKILPEGQATTIYEAAVHYKNKGIPLIILAGREYGSGSSRDWAAKGPHLLGVRAVIAESFERIHRSNLIGMGILPLQFISGHTREKFGLTGEEGFTIKVPDDLKPLQEITVSFEAPEKQGGFKVISRIDTAVEVEYYLNGGILQTVLKKLIVTVTQGDSRFNTP